jgi:hypothetical protein
MLAHPLAQISVAEALTGFADRRQRLLLDEHMRGEQNDTLDRVPGRVDQGDRRAVAVADEKRPARVYGVEEVGEDLERLLVKERGRARARRWR